ncbi:AarF/UbiB family protein [Acidobacteria bacterium AH-259-O06]|nr:AarF/UbiB family protein [Acidobacteria bacterium AH-259-G07]MDA2931259.1 AarF/UbiB family protein [Acidobacteria bacterium AH-259-O06]
MRYWLAAHIRRIWPLIWTVLLISPSSLRAEIPLPTPLEHYDNFDPAREGLRLLSSLFSELDPSQQSLVLQLVGAPGIQSEPKPSKNELMAALKTVDWAKWRPQVLELLLHRSRVLDIVPEKAGEWLPIVHDALLFFLDRLGEERLLERLLDQAALPASAQRGEQVLQFLSRTPTLQKIGQVLARSPDLPPDLRGALQVLENSLRTTSGEEIVELIVQEIGLEKVEQYRIRCSDEILAEATVGAVLRCSLVLPGETRVREAVAKVIKPYAISALREELAIFDDLTGYFGDYRDFYEIGPVPLSEMFAEIREALSKEIQVIKEQENLVKAAEYYGDSEKVMVPEFYPFSTERVTFMEFVHGEKISDAFPGQLKARAKLARRLSDVLTSDVLLSPREEALFHGDPHAGNVFHVLDEPKHPYRIALLDWGLRGVFPRQQRAQLMQLFLGVYLKDTKRLTNHMGALIEGDDWESPEKRERIRTIVEETLREKRKGHVFDILGELMKKTAREGYQIRFNIGLFIKSQITVNGILSELDPKLKQDKYLMNRISRQALKEMPKRLLYTVWFPAWNSHNYRSMLSNEDIKDMQVNSCVKTLKKAGKGLWRVVRWPVEVFIP